MFIIKQLNYKAQPADFDRVPKLLIQNNNDKNQLQGFMACQMMEALDVLNWEYVGVKQIQTDVFAFSRRIWIRKHLEVEKRHLLPLSEINVYSAINYFIVNRMSGGI